MSLLAASLLSITAAVAAVGPEGVQLDRGLIDGLREGDVGNSYYVLTVSDRPVRIDAGQLRITDCGDASCLAQPVAQFNVYAGFRAEFKVPATRQSPAELLRLANLRLDQEQWKSALSYLRKLGDMLPDDPLVARRIEMVERRLASPPQAPQAPATEHPSVASKTLPEAPSPPPDKTIPPPPQEPPGPASSMYLLPGGIYFIGVSSESARFHNQYPQFEIRLGSFRIDVRPASVDEYTRITGRSPRSRAEHTATGLSFQEASDYCQTMGKRLPTEFEWEVAAHRQGIEVTPNTAEWTNSWYMPYPGNQFSEREYGRRFRVVRGYEPKGSLDPKLRFFMAPEEWAPDVAVRCAQDVD